MLSAPYAIKGTTSLGVPVGPKTRIFTACLIGPSRQPRKEFRFLPARNLIAEEYDTQVTTLSKDRVKKVQNVSVEGITEVPTHPNKLWSYVVLSESGLVSVSGFGDESTVHSDAVLSTASGEKETLQRLLSHYAVDSSVTFSGSGNPIKVSTKRLRLKTYSFTYDRIENSEVHFLQSSERNMINIQVREVDLRFAHDYSILNQGLLVNVR